MKLAEALILRADIQKRITQTAARAVENARAQEGDMPGEDPNKLIQECLALIDQYVVIVEQINRTNLSVSLANGNSLTKAIAQRDGLKAKINMYRAGADGAVVKQARGTRTEVKYVPHVSVSGLREEADKLSKAFRELDSEIQAANWTHNLLD